MSAAGVQGGSPCFIPGLALVVLPAAARSEPERAGSQSFGTAGPRHVGARVFHAVALLHC